MDKRASKPPTTGSAKPTPGEEAKKKMSVAERLSTPSTNRTSALSIRANGSSITKPPTRPVSSAVRKSTTKLAEDAATKDENRRLSRASTPTASLSSRTAKAEDKTAATTRRTTLGSSNGAASAPPKRPSTLLSRPSTASTTASSTSSARTRPAAPLTTSSRPSSRTTVSTASTDGATSLASAAARGAASMTRPMSRDTIPEEPDSLSNKAHSLRSLDAPFSPSSPRKIEIRSNKSATPTLKPQAASDVEIEIKPRPKLSSRHSRSRSNQVERPSTAPNHKLTEQEQSMREMEVMQSFLRESIARDTLAAEIVDLKSELQQLERQNKQLTETAHTASSRNKDGAAEILQQLQSAKATHEGAISELKSAHAGQIKSLESELESYRGRSSRLDGVETKIEAVQEALEETRNRASQNEKELQQELQEKEQDRGQLAAVVEELREEIDRCQLKLDEDTRAQAREKEEAARTAEQMRKELAEVNAVAAEAKNLAACLDRELADERQRNIDSAAVESTSQAFREQAAREIERLNASVKSAEEVADQARINLDTERISMQETVARALAEKAAASERLEGSLNDSHKREIEELKRSAEEVKEVNSHLQAEIDALRVRNSEYRGRNEAALANSTDIIKGLKDEAERLIASHAAELETNRQHAQTSEMLLADLKQQVDQLNRASDLERSNSEKSARQTQQVVDELRREVGELHALRESEKKSREESNSMQQVVEDLQSRIQRMQHDSNDGRTVVGELQTQLTEFQQTKADLEEQHKQELQRLHTIIESLQSDSSNLAEGHSQTLAQRDQESKAIHVVVEGLQAQVVSFQQQLHDTKFSKDESMRHADDLIKSLREEIRAAKETSAAELVEKNNEKNELMKVAEQLQQRLIEHQQSSEDQRVRSEMENNSVGKALEGLQNELQVLQHKLHDEEASRQLAVQQTRDLQQTYDDLRSRHEDLCSTHSTAEQQLLDLHQVKSARDDLQKRYDAVTIAVDEKQCRIDELVKLVSEANEASATAEASLSNAQEELKSLQQVLNTFTRDQDDKITERIDMLNSLEKEHKMIQEEKLILEKKLGDIAIQHNRELEEETQKHENTYRELQNRFIQLKEGQSRRGAGTEEQFENVRCEMQNSVDDLKSEHARTISALADEHAGQLKEMMRMHSVQIEDLRASAAGLSEKVAAERDQKHEEIIAALKSEHARAIRVNSAEIEHAHHAALALLAADHASKTEAVSSALHQEHEAIREGSLLTLRADLVDVRATEAGMSSSEISERGATGRERRHSQDLQFLNTLEVPFTLTTPKNDGIPARGLSHVFVHLADGSRDDNTLQPSTPLAHAMEYEHSFSPTPAYPRDGNRAGAEPSDQHRLRKDNASLNALLKAARDEIAALKCASPGSHSTGKFAIVEDFTEHTRRDSTPLNEDQDHAMIDSFMSMSLEGTMESLRVQTEQLLELNDDFLAEQQRWSRRLQRKDSTQQRNTSLEVASR